MRRFPKRVSTEEYAPGIKRCTRSSAFASEPTSTRRWFFFTAFTMIDAASSGVVRKFFSKLREVLAASLDQPMPVPYPAAELTVAQLLRLRCLELTVHAWDVAKSVDLSTVEECPMPRDLAAWVFAEMTEPLALLSGRGYFAEPPTVRVPFAHEDGRPVEAKAPAEAPAPRWLPRPG